MDRRHFLAASGIGLSGLMIPGFGNAVAAGNQPLYAVALAVGLAILREGSEVVLFLYGIASGGTTIAAPVATRTHGT